MIAKRIAVLAALVGCSGQALAVNFVQGGGPSVIAVVNLTSGFVSL